jgi:conjugal transfer/entry exclusion protein
MSNRETSTVEPRPSNLLAMAIAAIVICAVAVLLMPAHATTEIPVANDADSVSVVGYLPAQVVNQATEIVAMTDTF